MRDRDIASETLMIDLYAMGSPNVVKIYIALEEMGLPYTVHPVDVFGEAQFSPEFLKLNPNAKVPVIVDREAAGGQPYTVFESGAILVYLADKTGRFLAKDGAARYDALQWMMVQMTTIGPMFGQYVHFMRFAPKGNTRSTVTAPRSGGFSRSWKVGSRWCRSLADKAIRSPTSRPFPGPATSEPFSARRRRAIIPG
jgi:glutathione S-transferase